MILSLLRKDPAREPAEALYRRAVEQARAPSFYEDHGVADTVEGRTELVMLHVFLLLARLKGEESAKALALKVSEAFFENMDDALREAGVGDLSVGWKIRKIAEDLQGRLTAYDVASGDGAAPEALAAALARNVYFSADAAVAEKLARYVRRALAALAAQPIALLKEGAVDFPPPEETSP